MSVVGMSRRPFFSAAAILACGVWLCLVNRGDCAGTEPPVPGGYFVQTWETDKGLPCDVVNDVVQGRRGFLWLATIDGLVRFDGVAFKQFDSPLLARGGDRNILDLAETADGRILMLSETGGLVQMKDGQFAVHPAGEGLAPGQLRTLFVAPSGAIWIGMDGGRLRRWQDGKISDFGPRNGLDPRSGFTFAADKEGRVWIASGRYLRCYEDGRLAPYNDYLDTPGFTVVASNGSGGIWICKNTELLKLDGDRLSVVSTNLPWTSRGWTVRQMFEDRHHALWISTGAHGLFRFAGGKFIHVETSQSQITSIAEDREGDIWAGTIGGGLDRLRPKLFHLYSTQSGLPGDVNGALCADGQGAVWVAGLRSGVVRIHDGGVFTPQLRALNRLSANSLCLDDQGWVWAGGRELYRFPASHPEQIQVVSNHFSADFTGIQVMLKSRRGDVWIGADPGLLGYFRGGRPGDFVPEKKFTGRQPRALAEDSLGRIWVGTESGRLYQLAYGKFTVFGVQDGLPGAPIRSLYAGQDGSLWIGTLGGGLVLWRNGKFTTFSTEAGLRHHNIAAVVEDDAGQLWCGTQSGIFHVAARDLLDFAAGRISRVAGVDFGRDDGLPGISCLGSFQPMACKTPDGRLWFATQQGVLEVDAPALKSNTRPPPAFVEGIYVNDRPLKITRPLRVPPLCRKMEFVFSVLSFASPQAVRIRYKLDGVDDNWVETVNHRAAIYQGLRPGKYRLHLQACNSDGVWNPVQTTLAFVVLPAWWQMRWLQGLALLVFLTGLVMSIRYWSQRRLKLRLERLERQRALEKERVRIARDLHDDLGATVTQVGLMLEELRVTPLSEETFKAQSAAVSSRVRTLARDLDAVVWSVNTGHDTLAELFAYMGQTFLECFHHTSIRPRLEMAEIVPNLTLAPEARHHLFMVVKEAMNNVIKHSCATEVILTLKAVGDALEIRIADNGRGVIPEATTRSRRHGLPNMRARIAQLGGELEVSGEPGRGTTLRILIPSCRNLRAGAHHPK